MKPVMKSYGAPALAVLIPIAVFIGVQMQSGLGWPVDLLLALLFTALIAAFFAAVGWCLAALLRRLVPVRVAVGFGALAGLAAVIPLAAGLSFGTVLLALIIAVPVLLAASLLGNSIRYSRRHGFRKPLAIVSLAAAIAFAAATLYWLVNPGAGPTVANALAAAPTKAGVSDLKVPDPGLPGPYAVASLYYGNGDDLRRPEYADGVTVQTPTVNGSTLLDRWTGLGGKLRTSYWGFGPDSLPLNGRVWHPVGDGPFPLVLIAHGNHRMVEYSDPGYAYLGEHLASHGYIAVSIDQNFLNSSMFGGFSGKENPVRAWHLLQHLSLWRTWQQMPDHPLGALADLDRIALIGHSRGGEAVVLAAAFNHLSALPENGDVAFDFGFNIRAIASIASVDGQYMPASRPAPVNEVSYLLITGLHDADVNDLSGGRAYARAEIAPRSDAIKAAVHVYGANHGQFNSVWGNRDLPPPFHLLLNKRVLLTPAEQERITNVYVHAFLAATVRDDDAYVPLLRNPAAGEDWLPSTLYVAAYADGAHYPVARFDEDIDLATGTIAGSRITASGLSAWREQEIPVPYGDRSHVGAYVAWADTAPASYTVSLSPGWAAALPETNNPALVLSLADGRQGREAQLPLDLTVRLTFADGTIAARPLSYFGTLQPMPVVKRTKLGPLEDMLFSQPLLMQRLELPLHEFRPAAGVDDLTAIELVFDITDSGRLYIDEIALLMPEQ